ncbi:hypothetical protein GLUCORHAEAF1_02615 [Komagataeibacter rhaeticus AF1]|nr:hypothetical protein GLUCORHAEAF1_02615 [Komagataeibacter rhaeticus AF1]
MTKSKRKIGLPALEDRFEFLGAAFVTADQATLRSAVFPVLDKAIGIERALRVWKKTGTAADGDLRALWLHEQRQVRRLMATAGAAEVIVDVLEFVEDDQEFGAVLQDAGQPLSELLKRTSATHWTRNISASRCRSIMWRSMRRIAEAIGLLHAQGLIHGRIAADVVITRGAEEPDFRLTGFEWSLWFAAPTETRSKAKVPDPAEAVAAYSFASDWKNFGQMLAGVLDLRLLQDGSLSAVGDAPEPNPAERSIIRRLVSPARTEPVDALIVTRAIDDIVRCLAREGAVRSGTFILHVSEYAGLGDAASKATNGSIEADDIRSQVEWAMADMAGGAELLVPVGGTTVDHRVLMLVTPAMVYEVAPANRADGTSTWDIAYCRKARLREEGSAPSWRFETHEVAQPIEIIPSLRQAWRQCEKLGPAALDWAIFIASNQVGRPDPRTDVRRALLFIQTAEAVIKALDALPVEVVQTTKRDGGGFVLDLRPRDGSDRDKMAGALRLSNTVDTLYRRFEEERQEKDEGWFLGPSSALGGDRRADVQATYAGPGEWRGLKTYRFEVDDEPESPRGLFLRPSQDTGVEGVIARRIRNAAALMDLPGLADVLSDIWLTRRTVRAQPDRDAAYEKLDEAKRNALDSVWATSPAYLVVGPPGVGKTHLATEVVRRYFDDEPSSRVLLTAQGHDALDNLQEAVRKAFQKADVTDALVVRTSTERRDVGIFDTSAEVERMLADLHASPLAQSTVLRGWVPRLEAVMEAATARAGGAPETNASLRGDVRATSDLLLDAANIVVTTTNSAAIERMVADRSQFDLVLVEEAAKATGPELVGALALSGKRLLIGDHHQLPPFDAITLEHLLGDHALSRDVLSRAGDLAGNLLREGEVEDLATTLASDAYLEKIRGVALRLIQPFKFVAEEDDRRARSNPSHRRVTTILNEQRRMHPAIATVVSEAFYDGKLITSPQRIASAYGEAAPIVVEAPLPAAPLVVVNFPHVSVTGNGDPMERSRPRWHNPKEVRAVLNVIRCLRPRPGVKTLPTLAILSPYGAQVAELKQAVATARLSGDLSTEGFTPVRAGLDFVATTDSFQGGEADVVIISLVRNNPRVGPAALGFLRDERRMNVLLSRAKSKLILVTSLDFLDEAVSGAASTEARDELGFITTVTTTIRRLTKEIGPDGIHSASIISPQDLEVRT